MEDLTVMLRVFVAICLLYILMALYPMVVLVGLLVYICLVLTLAAGIITSHITNPWGQRGVCLANALLILHLAHPILPFA